MPGARSSKISATGSAPGRSMPPWSPAAVAAVSPWLCTRPSVALRPHRRQRRLEVYPLQAPEFGWAGHAQRALQSGCRGAAEGSRGPVQGAHPRSGHPVRDDRRRAAQLLELASVFSPPEVCRWCRILRRRCPRTGWALLCTRGTRRCVACTVGSQRLEV